MTIDYQLSQQQQYEDWYWFCFLLIHNIFTLSKKQQKCNVSKENKNFSADGSEYNAVVDFLLFV